MLYFTSINCWLVIQDKKYPVWVVLLFESSSVLKKIRIILNTNTKEPDLLVSGNEIAEFNGDEVVLDYIQNNIEIHHPQHHLILELKNKHQTGLLNLFVSRKREITSNDILGNGCNEGFYHLTGLTELTLNSQQQYDIEQIDNNVIILFNIQSNIQEFHCIQVKMKLRSLLLKKKNNPDFEEVIINLSQTPNVHYIHFKTKYNQLSLESTLYIEAIYSNGTDYLYSKYLLYLFNSEGLFIHDKQQCLLPIEVITIPAFNSEQNNITTKESERVKIDITINTTKSIYRIPKRVESLWDQCKDYPIVEETITNNTLLECKKISLSENIPENLALHLFRFRHYYLHHYFNTIGFFVLKSTLQATIETGKDYINNIIDFVEEQKLLDSFIQNKQFSFIDILPYFSTQTYSIVLKERIGYKMIQVITINQIKEYIPHIIEILKHEQNDLFLNKLIQLLKENNNETHLFAEQLLWGIVNIIEKRDEYFDLFIQLFHSFAEIVVQWNPTIIYDINCANEMIARVEEINAQSKEQGFVQGIAQKLISTNNMKIESMKQMNNFSLPFLKGKINKIKCLKQYNSANRPMIIPVQVNSNQTLKDRCFMVKSNDDLLNDKLILILSNYIYNELKTQIDLEYLTYDIIELGTKKGIVEFVPDVIEIGKLFDHFKNSFSMIMGTVVSKEHNKQNMELAKFIYQMKNDKLETDQTGETEEDRQKIEVICDTITTDALSRQLNFAKSFALCCVLNYALMLRDRHGDNYLLQYTTGKIFHIDFGYVFGKLVPRKENEPEITRFSEIMKLLEDLHLTQSFYQYARWAWEKVKELSQNIITLFTFICYDSIEPDCLKNVRDRLLNATYDNFVQELNNPQSVIISDKIQERHQIFSSIKQYFPF
ncbi:phosphatidylinositol 3- and 4-kinase, putative [Entamoeba histolytica HM-1:IMSS-B]|uniref:PI3K/PI4K catalytic domain-containing protein n=6 Tax=Entamoeba histolytica TaxID=5759 RepID=C4M9A9_ENTH1|nr:hypothetical protein EHI_193070 [Entamoeba histolytica HM-1:IMSS]EMD45753.1 phosphatidylinositol 3 and 4kinase, putative [Entamoeba histolytica KU27]EMH75416.1 phosphatidylinositol 3- and 4-kinase, putative [Entamoeba histolytica HM-1:IMSS-B]EMS14329.1 phosphatidylinositol 3- and 4-kinase [Entamoeba histolytica HM-3:IMSS]ENY65903.1 phosphatidylinositol 3- and 4-kinase, putative [Entamoeba histolytica HM-1:IMSS-A]GAT98243.1 hypothetical protein CL6EHI_193070 [Entamoeba histolytica]|eukprot:XP_649370.2 hypothetical protein EHI_193070 [Entamoeba histolytica HM-1:IMSS]